MQKFKILEIWKSSSGQETNDTYQIPLATVRPKIRAFVPRRKNRVTQ